MKALFVALSLGLALLNPSTAPAAQRVGPVSSAAGPTPFISFARVQVSDIAGLRSAQFEIAPKNGSATRPIKVRYSRQYLQARGRIDAGKSTVTVPVFGLYAGRRNSVTITLYFRDGTSDVTNLSIRTAAYDGGTYSQPLVLQSRLPGTTLSYDFIMLKNFADPTSPIIIDSDGEIRWIGTAGVEAQPSAFFDNAFYLAVGNTLMRTELDGTTTTIANYASIGITNFHHNIDPGRDGIILDADTATQFESLNIEVDAAGNVLHTWALADIISEAMTAGGDDPTEFVKPSFTDWFHNNATAYSAEDDSLIVSSRENFVIALDYDTQAIKWILGDPTKHWHDFASLRAFALTLGPDTLPPIGQHAVSMRGDHLLLFDDGAASTFQMPPGETRTYSAPRKYEIDTAHFQATEIYHYLNDPAIYSPFCSSVYEDQTPDNYLVDYTTGGPYLFTEVLGLDDQGNVAFDYRYDDLDFCGTAWNASILHWENLNLK